MKKHFLSSMAGEKLELKIDYTKLYYQSGNRYKDTFNFNEFG